MKKANLKKLFSLAMTACLTVCMLTACGELETDTSDERDVYKIGICQLVQHDALDAATEGFQDALKEKLGDKVKFDLQNASGESTTCATITNQFVADDVDLIMANATAALQSAMAATGEIPIVATSITDFATALESDDWTGVTGINVTGTSDLAPLEEQADMIKELIPDAEKIGILYCSAEPNSKYQADVITPALEKLGFEVKEYTVADTNEIASVTTTACDEVDCIYIPTDNTIASASTAVNEVASPAGIPVVAGEEGICKGCGIATLSISYYSIGYEAGLMAYDILVNGANPAEMEIQYSTELTKKYISDRMDELEITVPNDYEEIVAN